MDDPSLASITEPGCPFLKFRPGNDPAWRRRGREPRGYGFGGLARRLAGRRPARL